MTGKRGNGQGTVWKEGSGYRWQVTIGYHPNGRRKTRSGTAKTKTAASQALNQVLADVQRGQIGESSAITVSDYAQVWLRRQHDVEPRTVKKYEQELDYVLEHIGSMRLQDVRAPHLEDVLAALVRRRMRHGQSMARSTLTRILMRLRSLFRTAVRDQIIYANPMEGIRLSRKKRGQVSKIKAFSYDEAQRFISLGMALYEADLCRLWPALYLGISMGLRRGEILGLRWRDIDFETSVLRIRHTRVMDVDGIKGSEPKTDNSRRDLRLPPGALALLKKHHAEQQIEKKNARGHWENSDIVFATSTGNWTHVDNLNRAMRMVLGWSNPERVSNPRQQCAWIRVPREHRAQLRAVILSGEALPPLTPHHLRHTYATIALRAPRHPGEIKPPLEVVSKNLGHANPAITLEYYRHVLDDEIRSTVIDLFPVLPTRPAVATDVLN
ncbi:tyrosine-type recombinase/integrase [Deinococcus sp. PESE-13]